MLIYVIQPRLFLHHIRYLINATIIGGFFVVVLVCFFYQGHRETENWRKEGPKQKLNRYMMVSPPSSLIREKE